MIKNGRVEAGRTPSAVSGRTSSLVKKGEALADGEVCPELPEIPLDSKTVTVQSDRNESDDTRKDG